MTRRQRAECKLGNAVRAYARTSRKNQTARAFLQIRIDRWMRRLQGRHY